MASAHRKATHLYMLSSFLNRRAGRDVMYWVLTIICAVIITGALLLVAGIDFLF